MRRLKSIFTAFDALRACKLEPEQVGSFEGAVLDKWQPESHTQTVTYDFESLCKSATFRNAMVEVYDSIKDRLSTGAMFAEELRVLRNTLETRLKS
jgi:hypothetical protein